MPIVECGHCGREFKLPPSHASKAKFCSRQCYAADRRIVSHVTCDFCGKQFEKKPSQIVRSKHNYCTNECSWAATRKRNTQHCEWCGKELQRIPAWQNKRHFCSKQCSGHGTQQIGPANRNWKGGRKVLQRDRSKAWTREVKDRAGHVCAICGAADELHAHHIESFARNKDLRYDVNNGVCVCARCHRAIHRHKRAQMALPLEAFACA